MSATRCPELHVCFPNSDWKIQRMEQFQCVVYPSTWMYSADVSLITTSNNSLPASSLLTNIDVFGSRWQQHTCWYSSSIPLAYRPIKWPSLVAAVFPIVVVVASSFCKLNSKLSNFMYSVVPSVSKTTVDEGWMLHVNLQLCCRYHCTNRSSRYGRIPCDGCWVCWVLAVLVFLFFYD